MKQQSRCLSRIVRCLLAAVCLSLQPLQEPMPAAAQEPPIADPSNTNEDGEGFVHLVADQLLLTDLEPPGEWPGTAPAQPSGGTFTLSELEDLALATNPTLQQAAAEVMRLEGIWQQVGLKPNPIFGYQAAEIGNEGSAGQQGLFLGQEFVRGDKLELNRAAAGNAVAQARWNRETQQQRVLNTVRRRFYETLGATKTFELAKELQGLAEESARISRELEQAGEGTQLQVLQAEIEARNNQLLLNNARIRRRAALQRLAVAVGNPELQPQDLVGSLDQTPPGLEFDDVWNWLIERSPELQAAYYAVHRARWAIRRAEAEPIPNVEGQLGIAQDYATNDFVVNLQIGIPIPYHNRNQGNITAAQAEHIRACREIERLRLDLRDRLVAAFQNYQVSKTQADAYREEILPLAKKNLELVRRGYEQSQLDYLQLLTAQRTYFRRSLEAVNARTALWLSVVRIQGLVIAEGLAAPSEVQGDVQPPDINSDYPLGLFPMLLP